MTFWLQSPIEQKFELIAQNYILKPIPPTAEILIKIQ